MSARGINKLIGRLIISESDRGLALSNRRPELLQDFDLEPTEVAAIAAIRADSLAEFAAAVEVVYNQQVASSEKVGRRTGSANQPAQSNRTVKIPVFDDV